MIENITSLKVEKEKYTYQLIMSLDSPLGEVFDVLSEMRAYVFEMIKKHHEQSNNTEEQA